MDVHHIYECDVRAKLKYQDNECKSSVKLYDPPIPEPTTSFSRLVGNWKALQNACTIGSDEAFDGLL